MLLLHSQKHTHVNYLPSWQRAASLFYTARWHIVQKVVGSKRQRCHIRVTDWAYSIKCQRSVTLHSQATWHAAAAVEEVWRVFSGALDQRIGWDARKKRLSCGIFKSYLRLKKKHGICAKCSSVSEVRAQKWIQQWLESICSHNSATNDMKRSL